MINCKPFRRNRHGCCSFILLPKASRHRDVTAHHPPRRVTSDGQPVQRSILEHGGVDLHAPAKSTKCENGSPNDEARTTKSETMAKFQTRNALDPKSCHSPFGHSLVLRHSDFVISNPPSRSVANPKLTWRSRRFLLCDKLR